VAKNVVAVSNANDFVFMLPPRKFAVEFVRGLRASANHVALEHIVDLSNHRSCYLVCVVTYALDSRKSNSKLVTPSIITSGNANPALVQGASVTFEPGARTAWHTYPLGQTLIVTAGCGRAQREGGSIEEIRPGDVVWISPAEKHWHGASPTTAMTHIAIQEKLGCRLDGTGQRRTIPRRDVRAKDFP
jgi:quercetin dioxygenase-like cupin family protein